jgi:hypothetical protein
MEALHMFFFVDVKSKKITSKENFLYVRISLSLDPDYDRINKPFVNPDPSPFPAVFVAVTFVTMTNQLGVPVLIRDVFTKERLCNGFCCKTLRCETIEIIKYIECSYCGGTGKHRSEGGGAS